jgi:hypothetical protein
MPPRKRFAPAAGGTAPNADDVVPKTPRRPDVKTSTTKDAERVAFTWRLTPDQVIEHDDLILRLRRELGRARLDKATVLDTLMTLAAENQAIHGALLAKLQEETGNS